MDEVKITFKKINLFTIGYISSIIAIMIVFIVMLFNLRVYGVTEENLKIMVVLNVITCSMVILYGCAHGLKQHFSLVGFTIVYLVFNLGEYIANFNEKPFGYISFAGTVTYSYQDEAKGLMIMWIGVLTYFLAYKIMMSRKRIRIVINKNRTRKSKDALYNIEKVRFFSKAAMYVGAIATFIKVGLMIVQAQKFGYTSIYVNTQYNIPILNMFDSFFELGLFSYLVTKPSLKQVRGPIIIYTMYIFSTLLYGRRNAFVTGILIIIWYLFKMDVMKVWKKEILTKWRIIILVVLGIMGLASLYYFSVIRLYFGGGSTSIDISNLSMWDGILSVFEQIGFSGKLIPLSISVEEELRALGSSKAILYPITNYLSGNVIARILGLGSLAAQATFGGPTTYTLGSWLTYFFWPTAYATGGGTGTSYLAEAYIWLGFLGVIIINSICSYLLCKIDKFEFNSWKTNLFCMYSFSIILTLPRSSALDIIPRSVILIAYIYLLVIVSRRIKK